jgi:hypothetical protein
MWLAYYFYIYFTVRLGLVFFFPGAWVDFAGVTIFMFLMVTPEVVGFSSIYDQNVFIYY